ncbi:nucleotide exchange factor GrpE [Sneathiella marina]|uniref:Protein GrpE n=2 Tax=Sneathiella marina TaxID=2950108 RepID=A0ABY4W256_9PROT|nr:nucleotide exchange factor GrpE [Sneathiella marina]USG61143.1 nucleotide exchange factor GrpE [Sneathiella marina]
MNDAKQTPPANDQTDDQMATPTADSEVVQEPSVPNGEGEPAAPAEDSLVEEQAAEIAELKDKILRAMAEVENMRRRASREKEDAHNYAVTKFARDMLAVSDNLRRAIDSIPAQAREQEDVKHVLAGIELTESELLNTFEKHKIKKIEAEGQKFDPNQHQAMFEVENPAVEPGTVLQVVQTGYAIADRLLRPAMVGVAKGGQKKADVKVDQKA